MDTLVLERETQTQYAKKVWTSNDVLVIILLNKNFNFGATRTPYDLTICGKKMWEWTSLAVGNCEVRTTVCTEESDILTLIKPYLNNDKKYTVVLYSDTPLFSAKAFDDALSYFALRQANVLKLKRGYVFDTEYIKNAESLMAFESTDIGTEQDFFEVSDMSKLYDVTEILRNRILDYHIANGVIIENKNTTHIDSDVIIGAGSVICGNNSLYGQTYVGKNCVIEPNNTIRDSIISDNCILKSSYIQGSRLSENLVVGPFESVIDKSN